MTLPVEDALMGYFAGMALVSAISAGVLRSAPSAAFAAMLLAAAAIELHGHPIGLGARPLQALFAAAYLAAVVAFAFALLRTLELDRALGRATLAVLAVNVVLVFAAVLWGPWSRFSAVNQTAFELLLVLLFAAGLRVRAHDRTAVPYLYLAALLGPAGAALLHAPWHFEAGAVWQSLFFAFAAAYANRGIQGERDRVERLAYVDGLTGVANRRTFDETLVRMWNVARRAQVPIAIAMVDIDHFKRLNDTRGHQVGDECLRRVAGLCSSALRRAGDCFARYGGEEFAAILVNVDADHAQVLAEHMRRVVESDGGITISVGVASRIPSAADDPLVLVADADAALYRAKNEGRNRVCMAVSKISAASVS
jgi:diguanylate cyclase (GGDEF)-like protein